MHLLAPVNWRIRINSCFKYVCKFFLLNKKHEIMRLYHREHTILLSRKRVIKEWKEYTIYLCLLFSFLTRKTPPQCSQFFLRVQSSLISARTWNVAGKYLKRFNEIPRLKLRAGEGFCEDLFCQKTRVEDGGELERALDDAIGTGSTVRSRYEKRVEKNLCERR